MAYIALYRKWRPKTFEDVVGQSHITDTLKKAIDTDKVGHAYLFSGPRGTGKTSTAKIFARAMNCIHGPTSHPCNECEVCRHIMDGESMDVVEIDAASNRSIEDIRTLRETVKFMPAEGHKKIYIIDEVHMLTTEAFNALLKTLEEPPGHVIFILATTEPERIPMTILSRCQRYEFRRITSDDITQRILYIAEQEHIDITKGAAHILAVQADGGMRDALSMLDQCVSNAEGTIDEALVRNLLGLIGKDWLFSLSNAVVSGDGETIVKDVDEIVRMGKEPQVILTELLAHLRALMIFQAAPQSDTLAGYDDCRDELAKQAETIPAARVFQILQVLQEALLSAKTSPEPRIAVEMGLLRASRPVVTGGGSDEVNALIQGLVDRIEKLERLFRENPQSASLTAPLKGSRGTQDSKPTAPFGGTSLKREAVGSTPPFQGRCLEGGGFPQDEPTMGYEMDGYEPEMEEYLPPPPPEFLDEQHPQSAPLTAPLKGSQGTQDSKPTAPSGGTSLKREAAPTAPAASQGISQAAQVVQNVPDASHYEDIWKKAIDILNKEKKKAIVSCLRMGKIVYIGQTEVVVELKTEFMVKRASREDYYSFVDDALAQIIGKGYHMLPYLTGDPALAEYIKKNSKRPTIGGTSPAAPAAPSPADEPAAAVPAPESVRAAAPETTAVPAAAPQGLQEASLDDMDPQERAAAQAVLQKAGDCAIYVEHRS